MAFELWVVLTQEIKQQKDAGRFTKNQHLFRRFRFEKVEKEPKLFQKIQKRTTKKSEEPWIFRVLFFKKKKKRDETL